MIAETIERAEASHAQKLSQSCRYFGDALGKAVMALKVPLDTANRSIPGHEGLDEIDEALEISRKLSPSHGARSTSPGITPLLATCCHWGKCSPRVVRACRW